MRTWLLPLSFPVMLAAQQAVPLDAPIARVRLHPDEAWVTRVGKTHLAAPGTYKLQVNGLPPGLKVEDLQASAKGPAALRLGDVSVASDVRLVTETPEWKKLEAERDTVREKRDTLEAQGEAAQQELAFLKGLQASYDKELSSRLTLTAPNPALVVELGKGLQARMSEILTGERKRRRDLEKLAQEEARINAEIQKRAGERRTAPSRVSVEVTTAQESAVELELSYRVRSARWKPLYEARLSEDRKKLDLALYASVTQNTGENWENVRLEISNARPSRSLAVPLYSAGQSVDWMKQPPLPVYPAPMAAPAPLPENKATQLMSVSTDRRAPQEEAEVPSASLIEEASGLAATFLVDGAKDVPSDSEPHRFKVQARNLEPALALFTTPRLDSNAYLLARFAAPGGLPLFPGSPVIRFAGNQRLGEAPLAIPAAGQPFSLGFGPYKALRVTLRRVDRKLEQAGAFNKERQWSIHEQIELVNDGSESVDIEVQDRILKSASDQVKINLAPEFTPGWTEPVPGVRSWKLSLKPGEPKRLEMPVTIRTPKDGVVTGLDDLLPTED